MPPVGSLGAFADSNKNYEPKTAQPKGAVESEHGCNVNASLRYRVAT